MPFCDDQLLNVLQLDILRLMFPGLLPGLKHNMHILREHDGRLLDLPIQFYLR